MSLTKSAVIYMLITQLITLRENRSITTARLSATGSEYRKLSVALNLRTILERSL